MKKIPIVIFAIFISMVGTVPTARADCVMGTPNCDPCPVGDSACVANAQTFTNTYGTLNTDITNTSVPPTDGAATGGSGFVALAPIPGLTDIQPTQAGLAGFFNNLYKFTIGIAAALAVIMIIWGGLEYSTQDSVSKKSDGKERILQAILGLVLVLLPVLVFSIINPSILNLSINLKPLDTKSGPPAQPASCPAGQFGTPPNCTANEGVNYTPLSSCTPGKWCFEARETSGATTYRCYGTRSVCINSTGYEGVQLVGACSLCP